MLIKSVPFFPDLPSSVICATERAMLTNCYRTRVRTLTGKEIELDIESDYMVSQIKEKVEEKEGIPPVQQRLIFGGKQMSVKPSLPSIRLPPASPYLSCPHLALLTWATRNLIGWTTKRPRTTSSRAARHCIWSWL